ncbi:MAG: hypothetical protein WKG00_05680 [Polyangiaceae bacterium]
MRPARAAGFAIPATTASALCGACLALLSPACAVQGDLCNDLRDGLARCGLPPAEIDCATVDAASDAYLADRLDALGCEGISSDGNGVDPRLCELAGWSCPGPIGPEPGNRPPRGPVLLVSGIDDGAAFDWNPRVREAARAVGAAEVHHVRLTPWASPAQRATDLAFAIDNIRAGRSDKVNLVCYAVGGLDCRYLVSPGGLHQGDATSQEAAAGAVASITTIATPHRGTLAADAALAALESEAARDLLAAMFDVSLESADPGAGALAETLLGLTLAEMALFDEDVVDAPGILYQSWAGVSHPLGRASDAAQKKVAADCVTDDGAPLLLGHPGTRDEMHPLLLATAPFAGTTCDAGAVVVGAADGMVAVDSARWGRFRGCVPADHYDVIGQIAHTTRDPVTGFDAGRLVAQIVSDLAEQGL